MIKPFFKALSFILVLQLSPLAYGKKIAFFWGGGGEPESRSTTIFDQDLRAMAPVLKKAGYELHLAFGTGHRDSEVLAEKMVGKNLNKPFTAASIHHEIESIETQINRGEITENDQILIIISTHGDHPDDHPSLRTHQVRVASLNKEEGIGLDRLFVLRDLAEQKKIKMAVMDFSCYSGASLALASKKTCVTTSSTAQEVSYTGLAIEFSAELFSGVDLETAFLKTRKKINDFAAPEISTFANSIVKMQTIINSSASSPIKPGDSAAAFNRHLQYLNNVHGIQFQDLPRIMSSRPQSSQLEQMKSIRNRYQSLVRASSMQKMSFEEMENAKSQTVIQYYFLERQVYDQIYHQFKDSQGPNPCRDFKF